MASLVLTTITNKECVICAQEYTPYKRKKVSCSFCPFECCVECVKTYLLTQTALPHCMSCKNQWDDAECDKILEILCIQNIEYIENLCYLRVRRQRYQRQCKQ